MSFSLHVKISGLCMFVPEPSGGSDDDPKGRMHVLMPATGGAHHAGHAGSAVEAHSVRLIYNGIFAANGSGGAQESDIVSVPLEGTTLTLGASGARSASIDLPPAVVDISTPQRANAKVKRALIDDQPLPHELASRVVLEEGRTLTHEPGATWHYPEGGETDVEMTPGVFWTLEMDGAELAFTGADGAPRTLRPVHVDGADQMWIELYHVPVVELPPARPMPQLPGAGEEPGHFEAFHSMLGVAGRPLPRFRSSRTSMLREMSLLRGTSPYTCMTVRGAL